MVYSLPKKNVYMLWCVLLISFEKPMIERLELAAAVILNVAINGKKQDVSLVRSKYNVNGFNNPLTMNTGCEIQHECWMKRHFWDTDRKRAEFLISDIHVVFFLYLRIRIFIKYLRILGHDMQQTFSRNITAILPLARFFSLFFFLRDTRLWDRKLFYPF